MHQDKSQIEFLTENKRKLQQQLEEECDQLRKDKIRLTGTRIPPSFPHTHNAY